MQSVLRQGTLPSWTPSTRDSLVLGARKRSSPVGDRAKRMFLYMATRWPEAVVLTYVGTCFA